MPAMPATYSFTTWFRANWSRAALPTAILLFLLSPFLLRGISVALWLVFLQLPVYMLHQYEEHAHNAFRDFVNRMLGGGKVVLGDTAIFWINIGGVWALDMALIYLAAYVNSVFGLLAIYLTLVNGLLHIVMAVAQRRYNPGLWTSIVLFLPVGGYALYRVTQDTRPALAAQLLGVGVALLIHVAIVLYVRLNIARSRRQALTPAPARVAE